MNRQKTAVFPSHRHSEAEMTPMNTMAPGYDNGLWPQSKHDSVKVVNKNDQNAQNTSERIPRILPRMEIKPSIVSYLPIIQVKMRDVHNLITEEVHFAHFGDLDRRYRRAGTSPEGGRSPAAEPQFLFGCGPIRKRSSPPARMSAWVNHERVSGLPFSLTLCT